MSGFGFDQAYVYVCTYGGLLQRAVRGVSSHANSDTLFHSSLTPRLLPVCTTLRLSLSLSLLLLDSLVNTSPPISSLKH
jgi:hypothetical protein